MTVARLRLGRTEVLADLLDGHGRDMQAVAYLVLRNHTAAEDAVADALLIALDKGRELRDENAVRAWLLRIVTNRALRMRERSLRVVELDVAAEATAAPPGPDRDDLLALWQAVSNLPPRMRAAIGLRYYLDLPIETVAHILDVSPNTIKTQLKSALAHLRRDLAEEGSPLGDPQHA
jgi:RNA polymerase sigma factor (sigma-70 family)